MISKYECSVTGKQFDDGESCFKHEISHKNYEEDFKYNFEQALIQLDKKYNTQSKLESCILITYSINEGFYLDHTLKFSCSFVCNGNLNGKIFNKDFHKSYGDGLNFSIHSVSDLIYILEKEFFMPKVLQKYEGVFHNSPSSMHHYYLIDDIPLHTIYESFKGKRVRIELIE